jgi:hypothetical protein
VLCCDVLIIKKMTGTAQVIDHSSEKGWGYSGQMGVEAIVTGHAYSKLVHIYVYLTATTGTAHGNVCI